MATDCAGGPYLTVFAASMGGIDLESEAGARRVLDATASTEVSDADRSRLMTIMLRLASDAAWHILEAMMTTSEYEKTLAERSTTRASPKTKHEARLGAKPELSCGSWRVPPPRSSGTRSWVRSAIRPGQG